MFSSNQKKSRHKIGANNELINQTRLISVKKINESFNTKKKPK